MREIELTGPPTLRLRFAPILTPRLGSPHGLIYLASVVGITAGANVGEAVAPTHTRQAPVLGGVASFRERQTWR
jgi:hypothetical protein